MSRFCRAKLYQTHITRWYQSLSHPLQKKLPTILSTHMGIDAGLQGNILGKIHWLEIELEMSIQIGDNPYLISFFCGTYLDSNSL